MGQQTKRRPRGDRPSIQKYKTENRCAVNKRRRAQTRANRFGHPVKYKDGSTMVTVQPEK